jgi:hypothetical protein
LPEYFFCCFQQFDAGLLIYRVNVIFRFHKKPPFYGAIQEVISNSPLICDRQYVKKSNRHLANITLSDRSSFGDHNPLSLTHNKPY